MTEDKCINAAPQAVTINQETQLALGTLKRYIIEPRVVAILVDGAPGVRFFESQLSSTARQLDVGLQLAVTRMPPTRRDIQVVLDELGKDPKVHGILLFMPQDPNFDHAPLLAHLAPEKDLLGITPRNLGLAVQEETTMAFPIAGPILELSETQGLRAKTAVLLGGGTRQGRYLLSLA